MKNIEQAEIIVALKTIKEVCKNYEECYDCPLGYECGCYLGDHIPKDYNINQQGNWKAFVTH